jgi:hypothetical protein
MQFLPSFRVRDSLQLTVPYYFDGTGYGLVTDIKEIETPKRGVLKFHTNSQVENALLFYKGNEVCIFCPFIYLISVKNMNSESHTETIE